MRRHEHQGTILLDHINCAPATCLTPFFITKLSISKQLAAQRFVNYWESRRSLFGPTKYVMRMTLGEALRDDFVALEVGYLCLLPHDESGRPIVIHFPARHTREGYTAESMVRLCCDLFWWLC